MIAAAVLTFSLAQMGQQIDLAVCRDNIDRNAERPSQCFTGLDPPDRNLFAAQVNR